MASHTPSLMKKAQTTSITYLSNSGHKHTTAAYNMHYFQNKQRVWCWKVLQEINKAKAWANTMHTVCHDRDNLWFRVTEFDRPNQGITSGQYRVHLRNKTCDCGKFDTLRYPCAHVIIACQNLRLNPMSYVDEVYKLETM
ncbi:hypothetical protein J1N35_006038 [Gossypium stocksii]|uniref:SWIM-type domain-containing protein n=1 Tax=Gossypium stocksii TaxID=47602 RepID=A0A9D3WFK0_9ROSI|nr:hypothetical protein J1N35_006038 [Gossypium stocksii]